MTQQVPLGELAEFINGVAFKPADWEDEGKRIIRIQNLTDCSKPFNRTSRSVADKYHVMPGDLLVSWSATLGVFEWGGPETAIVNQHIFRVVPDEQRVVRQYLKHMLADALLEMERHLHGATMQHVNRREFLATEIPLPPLAEQKRIAKILDAADALRAKRRESLVQLDALLQSTFLEMFGDPVENPKGWPMVTLGDVVERFDGGKNVAQSETPTKHRILRVSAVTSGEYRPDESKFLPADIEVFNSHFVKAGDLLISRANTSELVGATAYVWKTPENIVLPDKIWRFVWKPGAKIEPLFVYFVSHTKGFRRLLGTRSSGTSGSMKNIPKPKLLGLPIPKPPHDFQRRFTTIVQSVEQHKFRLRAHRDALDTLFASLQWRAFAGEL